ncbi:MAG TPA: Na+/H+ antiporter NhaA [Herpetosiphonaceae bacterium]
MAQRNFLAPHWSVTPIARILGPMQKFINRSASSGIVLIVATVAALVVANSGLAQVYNDLLHTEIGITVGPLVLREDLLHWINDGLMAIFFFLVGLEIKREVSVGELSELRAAALPIVAAIGGVVVPATIYMLFNVGRAGAHGWGVPMATDIAFALGCLTLLGNRIPFALKIFLTAVAIVDDLIAVLVIAFFYSGGINFVALGVGFVVLALLVLANIFGIRNFPLYIGLGLIVWVAFLESGVHATIAGVLIALTIPARNRIDGPTFVERVHRLVHEFQQGDLQPTPMLTDERQQSVVIELEELCEQVQAPLQKMEHSLHSWVSFLIMPIFALANAGVTLSLGNLGGETLFVALGVIFGLVLGKPIGLLGASWLAVRSGLAVLPPGVSWSHMTGAGILAGIGFTMSLFIASLGFGDPDLLSAAKFSILIASLIAGTVGFVFLSRLRTPVDPNSAE